MRVLNGILLVVALTPLHALAQQVIISGRVVDSETLKPIAHTNVFIANSSFGTATTVLGNFRLLSDNRGEAYAVLSVPGYETQRQHIVYSGDEAVSLGTIRLKASKALPDEATLKASRDDAWRKDLKKFKAAFLGKDGFASDCTIENPWVIDLHYDDATRTLTATSPEPIRITNKALGYQLNFYLRKMALNAGSYSIDGDAYFIPLQASTQKESDRWAANRKTAFDQPVNVTVAHMLPLDYTPEGSNSMQKQQQVIETLPYLYEQIYVHTDRPYYYAGEQLWFKGYVNYLTPSYRDSLSRTVYIDLITPTKKILISKILKVDSGRFSGELDLPVGLDGGTYNFRAYTNLQRNFGDQTLYVKPVPLIELRDQVAKVPADPTAQNGVTITTSKNKYKTREKIDVQVTLNDENGKPINADLSMTVTDMKQVSPVHVSPNIVDRYPIKGLPAIAPSVAMNPFVVEYGITISGRFTDDFNKPERALINVVQMNPKGLVMSESDANGYFTVNHLMIYDSARFSITASTRKGKSYGKATLVDDNRPHILYRELTDSLRIVPTTLLQRDVSRFKGTDVRMLDEVEIRGKRIAEEYRPGFRDKRPYGKANYTLLAKDFKGAYLNVMQMIQGRFPGLIIRMAFNPGEPPRWVAYLNRNATSSVNFVREVIVTVNDNVMGGTPESILSMINPETVEAIELKTGLNVIYGSLSNQGILAIYTKDGSSLAFDPPKTLGTVKALGYTFSPVFSAPDYESENPEQPDYRSLIHWTPFIPISAGGTATVSFFSADLTTTYRIEIEGVTDSGKPVHVVKMIEVGN